MDREMGREAPPMRELFVEELAEVHGGGDTDKIREMIRDLLLTTFGCGEEGPGC